MGMKNKLKILIGVLSGVVIFVAVLNQFGVIDEIKDIKKTQEIKKKNGVWDSKTLGDSKIYIEIFDAEAKGDLAGNIGYLSKKKVGKNDDEAISYEKIETMKNYSYSDVFVGLTQEKVYKNNDDIWAFFMFVPDDCEYVTIADKRVEVQHGSINTINSGEVNINLCLFPAKYNKEFARKGKVKLYTKKGKIYQYSENGDGKWL